MNSEVLAQYKEQIYKTYEAAITTNDRPEQEAIYQRILELNSQISHAKLSPRAKRKLHNMVCYSFNLIPNELKRIKR